SLFGTEAVKQRRLRQRQQRRSQQREQQGKKAAHGRDADKPGRTIQEHRFRSRRPNTAFARHCACLWQHARMTSARPSGSRPTTPLRWLLALSVVVGVLIAASSLLALTDSALSVWQCLDAMPGWLRALYLGLLGILGL